VFYIKNELICVKMHGLGQDTLKQSHNFGKEPIYL